MDPLTLLLETQLNCFWLPTRATLMMMQLACSTGLHVIVKKAALQHHRAAASYVEGTVLALLQHAARAVQERASFDLQVAYS